MNWEKLCESNVRSYKKLIAPITVTLLLIIAGLAFLDLQPSYVGPPPILDPNFQLWVGNAGARRLMLWDMEYVKGPADNVSLREAVVDGRNATELQVEQSGISDAPVYVYLEQTIDGARLTGLLEDDVGIWVLAEPCTCNGTSTARSLLFGVELNDGVHTLTFIFSDQAIEARTLLAHRFVYLTTQSGAWTYQHINVTRQYALAQWSLPEQVTFSLVFEAGALATGLHAAYVNSIHVAKPQISSGQYEPSDATRSEFSFCDARRLTLISISPEFRIWQ
jgi:hypothetical protein